jgi:L,D-transpeptidase ErfK/SrfK
LTVSLPTTDEVIGEVKKVKFDRQQFKTIHDYGMKYQVGYLEFKRTNPKVDLESLPIMGELVVPTFYILPDAPREGLVINLPELRMYFYPPNSNKVITYPVGIGRDGNNTPVAVTEILEKIKDPHWSPPKSARDLAFRQGVLLPKLVWHGSLNPMGNYAIRLAVVVMGANGVKAQTILIHGNNNPSGVGKRLSAGCVRMFNDDVAELFKLTKVGTKVTIVDQPVKAGWKGDELYLEIHYPVDTENHPSHESMLEKVAQVLTKKIAQRSVEIDWSKVMLALRQKDGLPKQVGIVND